MSDRAGAVRRVQRIRAFRTELAALTADGATTLTPEQRQQIDAYHDRLLRLAAVHDVDRSDAAGQLSRGIQVIALLAAVTLTAAIYSLVARYWGRLDLPVQASLLCAFPLMSLVGVELAARRERSLYVASIFAIVGYGSYWLAVTTLGERLGIPLAIPLIWGGAVFGITLALAYGFRLVFAAALVALLAALAGSALQAVGIPWFAAAELPEMLVIPAFLLALLAPRVEVAAAGFGAITRAVGLTVTLAGLLLLSSAGQASVLPFPANVTAGLYQALMLVTCGVALTVAARRGWSETVYLTAVALTVFLCVRFIDWFWDVVPRFVFFLGLAVAAFAWLFALQRMRHRVNRHQQVRTVTHS